MHLDTHVVVWLYADGIEPFPPSARRLLNEEPLAISPMVALELALLHETGRVTAAPEVIQAGLGRTLGLVTSSAPFTDVVGAASDLTWTRDPFDRLICAQAVAENQLLLTKDRLIRKHLPLARWDN